jgi:argininosuccinate lyase
MKTLKRIKRIIEANVLYRKDKITESEKVPNQLKKALSDIDKTIESTKRKINSSTEDLHAVVEETISDLTGNRSKEERKEKETLKEALAKLSREMKRDTYA